MRWRRFALVVAAVLMGGGIALACKDALTGPTATTAPSFAERRNWMLDFRRMPDSGAAGVSLTPVVQVAFTDSEGQVRNNASFPIEVSLAENTTGATLRGTTTRNAVDGVASFPDLWIDRPGIFRLVATAKNTATTTSTPVSIVASDSLPTDALIAVVLMPATATVDSGGRQPFCQFYKFASGRKINPVIPSSAYCDSLLAVYKSQP